MSEHDVNELNKKTHANCSWNLEHTNGARSIKRWLRSASRNARPGTRAGVTPCERMILTNMKTRNRRALAAKNVLTRSPSAHERLQLSVQAGGTTLVTVIVNQWQTTFYLDKTWPRETLVHTGVTMRI